MNQIGGAHHHHHHHHHPSQHPSHHHHRYQETPLTRHHRERFQEMAKSVDQSLSEPQDLSRRCLGAPPPPVRYPGYPPPPPPPPLIKTERESSSPAPAEVTVKTEPEDPGYGLAVYSENYQERELTRSFSLPARDLEQAGQPVERQLSLDRAASRQHQAGAGKEEAGSSRTIIGSGGDCEMLYWIQTIYHYNTLDLAS